MYHSLAPESSEISLLPFKSVRKGVGFRIVWYYRTIPLMGLLAAA